MIRKNAAKIVALLLALCVLVSLSACGDPSGDGESTTAPADVNALDIKYNEMKLAYDKWDTLDPFKAQSAMNRNLIPLLYDSLFALSSAYEATPQIAGRFTMSGTSVHVTLNEGVRFSDGRPVTAYDAAYSFDCAKHAAAYKARLAGFTGVTVTGDLSLTFALASPDPYAVACLTFPVVKQNSVQVEYDKLPDVKPPVGSGRYILGRDIVLSANHARLGSFWPQVTSIRLVSVTDAAALLYSLEIGNVSFAFDDMGGGSYKRISANSAEYIMNSLVFLGMNQENSSLSSEGVRRAVMLSINRQSVIDNSYQSHAVVAFTPFNPRWYALGQREFRVKYDPAKAKSQFEQEGFGKINDYKIRNDGARSLTFKLIVNAENSFKCALARNIAADLAKLNVHVYIDALEPEQFFAAYDEGDFDMYIGEVALAPNMSLAPFFGGDTSRGIYSAKAEDAYADLLRGGRKLAEFVAAFNEDSPFIPLCYRKGVAASVRDLVGATGSWYGDLYRDIEQWALE